MTDAPIFSWSLVSSVYLFCAHPNPACFLLAGSWTPSSCGHCNKVGSDLHTPGQFLLVCECGLHLPLLIPGHSGKQTGLHFCSLLIFFQFFWHLCIYTPTLSGLELAVVRAVLACCPKIIFHHFLTGKKRPADLWPFVFTSICSSLFPWEASKTIWKLNFPMSSLISNPFPSVSRKDQLMRTNLPRCLIPLFITLCPFYFYPSHGVLYLLLFLNLLGDQPPVTLTDA